MNRTTGWLTCCAIAFAAAAFSACNGARNAPANSAASNGADRGQYLVTITGCGDCHTPKKMGANGPEPDRSRDLSGHPEQVKMASAPALSGGWAVAVSPDLTAWAGPWGQSFAANLTPDQNTGLGTWTEDMFVKAMRTGKHMGVSRPILPPMPWQDFAQMSDADLKAIFAYLRNIKPVVNHVPDPVPPGGDD